MNDPLYNHPVWRGKTGGGSATSEEVKVAGEQRLQPLEDPDSKEGLSKEKGSETSQMESIVNEIIRSKFEASDLQVETQTRGKQQNLEEVSTSRGDVAIRELASTKQENLKEVCSEETGEAASVSLLEEATHIDPDCTECGTARSDPLPSELVMYLHALSYKVCNYSSFLSVYMSVCVCVCRERSGHFQLQCQTGRIPIFKCDV